MKRKLVKQAGQAITITLPIEWIRNNGLKAGEEIDIVESEKNLILSSKNRIISKKAKIDFEDMPIRQRYIYTNAAYAAGIDELEIKAESRYYPDLNQNIGFAVVKQKGESFTIKDLSGNSEQELEGIFKRVFQMVLSYFETAMESITKKETVEEETINARDREINKFILYLERSIVKLAMPDPYLGKIMFAYAFALETISDDIVRLWRNSIKSDKKISKDMERCIVMTKDSFEKMFASYYYCRKADIDHIVNTKQELRKIIERQKRLEMHEMIMFTYLLKIVETHADMSHLAVMKNIERL